MSELPDWFAPVVTINTSQTVVSSTSSTVTLPKKSGRQYLRLTNLGPYTEFLNFKSKDAVKRENFRLANGETFETTLGNRIVDTISVISSASSTSQRILKMETY